MDEASRSPGIRGALAHLVRFVNRFSLFLPIKPPHHQHSSFYGSDDTADSVACAASANARAAFGFCAGHGTLLDRTNHTLGRELLVFGPPRVSLLFSVYQRYRRA